MDAQRLLDGLNPQQRAAVLHSGTPLLIVAGAGSGKTRVLTHRIAYLLAERGATPGEVLAITFTNKAAGEMRERVAALVGGPARSMWVLTFHSMCVRILRAHGRALDLRPSFSIYDADDSRRLMTMVGQELDLDPKRYSARALAARVSNAKNELITPSQWADRATSAFDKIVAEAYPRYQQRLAQAHALDFDDLIMSAVRLLQEHPEVREHYRRRFHHVLVDEYQDTNHAQYVLVRELVGDSGELAVVGDADQSIYAFRGATIRNITEFERDFPAATTILLEQNYRSTQTILAAANAVIARNPNRKPKNLWADAGAGEPIAGYVAENEHDEANWVGGQIAGLDPAQFGPSDVAVFYRTNAQSRVLEEAFIRLGLPYRVIGGVRFYERKEIRDALAYLRLAANPDDVVSLRRVINTPRRGIGDRAQAFVAALADREGISFGAALERADATLGIAPRSAAAIREFLRILADVRDVAAEGTPSEVLVAVLDQTGYLRELEASKDPQDEGRAENLRELINVTREFEQQAFEQRAAGGDALTLDAFLEQVALVADADDLPGADGGVVTLMTLHTAKGLEFPVVFLTGMEDGVFPYQKAMSDPDELAEERRLAYVGITRARQRLLVSRSLARSVWGRPQWYPPSRFLDELPAELVTWSGAVGEYAPAWGDSADDEFDTPPAWFGGRGHRGGGVAGAGQDQHGYRGRGYAGAGQEGHGYRAAPRRAPSLAAARLAPRGGRDGRGAGAGVVPELAVGDRVSNDSFGLGTVLDTRGVAEKAQAQIDFGSAGVKWLVLRYAAIEKL